MIKSKLPKVMSDIELSMEPIRFSFKECILHPVRFLYFSRVYLRKKTNNWREPHTGVSFIVSIIAYGVTFTMPSYLIVVLFAALFWGSEVIVYYEWYMLYVATFFGFSFGFAFAVQKELEEVNKNFNLLQAIERLKRWKNNGTLEAWKESYRLKHPHHQYFCEN